MSRRQKLEDKIAAELAADRQMSPELVAERSSKIAGLVCGDSETVTFGPVPRSSQPISLVYTNWRGETRSRKIIPMGAPYWGTTEYHPEPCWLMEVYDCEKGAHRTCRLDNCDFTTQEDGLFPVEGPAGGLQAAHFLSQEGARCVLKTVDFHPNDLALGGAHSGSFKMRFSSEQIRSLIGHFRRFLREGSL